MVRPQLGNGRLPLTGVVRGQSDGLPHGGDPRREPAGRHGVRQRQRRVLVDQQPGRDQVPGNRLRNRLGEGEQFRPDGRVEVARDDLVRQLRRLTGTPFAALVPALPLRTEVATAVVAARPVTVATALTVPLAPEAARPTVVTTVVAAEATLTALATAEAALAALAAGVALPTVATLVAAFAAVATAETALTTLAALTTVPAPEATLTVATAETALTTLAALTTVPATEATLTVATAETA
ncbi:hypothetical protein ABZ652_24775, partial [Micromonospora chalcea]